MAAAVLTRGMLLHQPLWQDEAYTAVWYTGRGLSHIFDPAAFLSNNHVFYSVVGWAATGIFGDVDWVLRLGSVIPAVVSIGLLTMWAWQRWCAACAVAAGLFLALSPLHIAITAQARGYGIGVLGSTIALIGLVEAWYRREAIWVWISMGGALMLVLTLFVAAIGAVITGVMHMSSPGIRKSGAVASASAGVAALIWYWPLLDPILGRLHVVGSSGGEQLPWHGPLTGIIRHLVEPSIAPLHVLAGMVLWVIVGLSVAGLAVAVLQRGRWEVGLVAAVPIFSLLVMTALQLYVRDRYVLYLIPHVALLLGLGIHTLVAVYPPSWERNLRPLAAVAGLSVAVAGVATLGWLRGVVDLPRENYKTVARIAKGVEAETVFTSDTSPQALQFYLGRDRVEVISENDLRLVCEGSVVFVENPTRGFGFDSPCEDVDYTPLAVPQSSTAEPVLVWIQAEKRDRVTR